jgi:hypothetical protein
VNKMQSQSNSTLFLRRRFNLLILFACLLAAGLSGITGARRTAARSLAQAYFTNCANNTGIDASISILAAAPQMHAGGYFTPAAGDEFAVFRSSDNSCAFETTSLCAGAIVWTGSTNVMRVWGDDPQTTEVDGMLAGDRLCWRVWDASENKTYQATVVYAQDPSGNGTYQPDGLYVLQAFTPTALKLEAFSAASSHDRVPVGGVFAAATALAGFAYLTFRRRG